MNWQRIDTRALSCCLIKHDLCQICRKEIHFCAYVFEKNILCEDCYLGKCEPEKLERKKLQLKEIQDKRLKDLELAQKGELPGAIICDNGTVLGPENGLGMRQVLKEGLFDNLQIIPPMKDSVGNWSQWANFKSTSSKE